MDIICCNFDFYELCIVYELLLFFCVYVIFGVLLGWEEKVYEMYLCIVCFDFDDYNNDIEDGCYIISMVGIWMVFVKGFGGMWVFNDMVQFSLFIIKNW